MPMLRACLTALLCAAPAFAQPDCTAQTEAAARTGALIDRAMPPIEAKDLAMVQAILPDLQRRFAATPVAVPAAQKCGAVVAVYDAHQYARLTAPKDYWGRRPPSPWPVGSKYEFRDPRSADLAYALARAQLALGNAAAAEAALVRGLTMAPGNHRLITERLVLMIDQGRWREIDALLGTFLPDDKDSTAKERATWSAIDAQAQVRLGNWNGARLSLGSADLYDPGNGYAAVVRKEWEAMPVPPPKPARRPARRR